MVEPGVWEWCSDRLEIGDDVARPLRGEAWWLTAQNLRSASRFSRWPWIRGGVIGFRVALAPHPPSPSPARSSPTGRGGATARS